MSAKDNSKGSERQQRKLVRGVKQDHKQNDKSETPKPSQPATPWKITGQSVNGLYYKIRGTVCGGKFAIANCPYPVEALTLEAKANAEHIVKCVNSHDDLIELINNQGQQILAQHKNLGEYAEMCRLEVKRKEIVDVLVGACKCALADLEGLVDQYDLEGDEAGEHPAITTISELKSALKQAGEDV